MPFPISPVCACRLPPPICVGWWPSPSHCSAQWPSASHWCAPLGFPLSLVRAAGLPPLSCVLQCLSPSHQGVLVSFPYSGVHWCHSMSQRFVLVPFCLSPMCKNIPLLLVCAGGIPHSPLCASGLPPLTNVCQCSSLSHHLCW